jgi:hypothetical protein
MRTMRAAACCLVLCALGCSGDPLPPRLSTAEQALADSVTLSGLKITERELKVEAHSGPARVTLTLIPHDPIPIHERMLIFVMGGPPGPYEASRPCTVRILDRDGELLREDGATIGQTDTRPIADFDADMRVAEGLAMRLSQDERAWELYRWELRDVRYTAHELIGLRGPTQ